MDFSLPSNENNETTMAIRAQQQEMTAKHQQELTTALGFTAQAQHTSMGCIDRLQVQHDEITKLQKELYDCKRKLEVFELQAKRAKITSFCAKDLFPEGTNRSYGIEQLKHLISPDCPACALTQKGFKAALEFLGLHQAAIDAKTKLAKCNKDRLEMVKDCVKNCVESGLI